MSPRRKTATPAAPEPSFSGIRLTAALRDRCVSAVMGSALLESTLAIEEREEALFQRVIADAVGEADIRRFRSLPSAWLPRRDALYVRNERTGSGLDLRSGRPRPVPYSLAQCSLFAPCHLSDRRLSAEVAAFADDRAAHQRDAHELEAMLRTLLGKMRSAAQIKAQAPQIFDLVKPVLAGWADAPSSTIHDVLGDIIGHLQRAARQPSATVA